jgi:hypothetical protein
MNVFTSYKKTESLDKLKERMQSFDLLCINYDTFGSNLSRTFQKIYTDGGDWSHVGIIIKNDVLHDNNIIFKDKIYIWHSSVHSNGVQLYELDEYIKLKHLNIVKIGWCKLLNNPLNRKANDTDEIYNRRIEKIKKKMKKIYTKTNTANFNFIILKLVFPFLKTDDKKIPIKYKNSYFCSEYITMIYKLINVINNSVDPESVLPEILIKYSNDDGDQIFDEPILLKI